MSRTKLSRALVADLDERQRAVVVAPRGPVRVLAGAGSGKTRVLTRRIAHLVASEQVRPKEVLAVSFTVRAAGELRERLAELDRLAEGGLGLEAVRTSTFHAAAARQLAYFWPTESRPWRILDRKAPFIARAAEAAGLSEEELGRKEAQGEIEWAKASLIGPERYPEAARARRRAVKSDPSAIADVYQRYESLKARGAERQLDFDDVLLAMIGVLRSSADAADQLRSWLRCFLVDEFQDVTPLQHELLLAWLGTRDNVTAVGDPNQTIYSFAGAHPAFFAEFGKRFPQTASFRLDRDYRSTPQVTDVANALLGDAVGLQGQLPGGPAPKFVEHADEPGEAAAVAREIAGLLQGGVPAREVAVLFRANASAARFERALRAQKVPVGGEEGVSLCSLHAAKGLEWEAVFLVGLVEGAMPVAWAVAAGSEAVAEERRLLYVGITRARTRLMLTWSRESGGRAARPSRFVAQLRPSGAAGAEKDLVKK
ncbi:MAG: ATP-dependent helicase [Segniliparus sp.]|uniref:ATP-dependent helicase n=1 Tax=Segniliparus sp. TaxID=2804064 RepID=UPI003F312E08